MKAAERLQSVCAMLEQQGLDSLLAISGEMHSFLEPNPVFLLTGFKPLGGSLALLQRDGRLTLLVSPAWDGGRAQRLAQADRVIASDSLPAALQQLKGGDATPGRTGVAGRDLVTRAAWQQLSPILGPGWEAADALLSGLAGPKADEELEKARKAAAIADKGFAYMLEAARPGLSEYQLAAELDYYMKSEGADDNFLLFSASQHNLAVRAPGNRRLEEGDVILAEISPSWQGQFVQICRSTVIGKPSQEAAEGFRLLSAALRQGMAAAVPGSTMAGVTRAIDGVLKEAGYGEYCRPPYMRVRGHGLGSGSILPGDVSSDNETVLEENMIFCMHPNQYLPECGYLLCGETVVITPSGAQALTRGTGEIASI